MHKRLLFAVNVDWFFLSHRLPVALEARRQGYEVHVAAALTDKRAELASHGFIIHPLTITRGRAGLLKEFFTFFQLLFLFIKIRPDIAHLVTIKPVLFGGIAARLLRVPVVAAVSGLGFAYTARGPRAALRRFVAGILYRLALGRPRAIAIFQNPDDKACVIRMVKNLDARLIRGSGVDLAQFAFTDPPRGTPVIVMAARLLASKGVWEFAEAARRLRGRARFQLAGAIDPENPESLNTADLAAIAADGAVELLGHRGDMQRIFAQAHIVALPSYYGEGLPKTLVEAAACGRAAVTTDMPGCRDAIEPGVTGLLVPPRDAPTLAAALEQLIDNPDQCRAMGKAGRALAEREFDIRAVVAQHLAIYEALL